MSTDEFLTAASAMVQKRTSIPLPLRPSCPIGTASAFSGIEFLATKSLQKLLRVARLPETVDVKPQTVVVKRVSSRAQRQTNAEFMYLFVAGALASELCAQRSIRAHLRPLFGHHSNKASLCLSPIRQRYSVLEAQ